VRPADQLEAIAREAKFPVIVKPRTQVQLRAHSKGHIVESPPDLASEYWKFARTNRYESAFVAAHPDLQLPMVQEFLGAAAVYSISGFCDPWRGNFVARASRKLMQWPRRVGVGLAFEDASVDESLAKKLRNLCEVTGSFGVFEAEFVELAGELHLIDYNPRFFGQLGFDVARGLPSPYLVYLSAIESHHRFGEELEAALRWKAGGPLIYLNRTAFAWTRAAEAIVGRVPARLPASLVAGTPRVLDAVGDADDWRPAVVDGMGQIVGVLRHPRAALRSALSGY
jgi:D-aspartate ligase